MEEISDDTIKAADAIAKHEATMTPEDSASLIFFTNPHYLNILQQKKLCSVKDNAEEIKFYRKRIVSLFKEILKGTDESLNREIKEIHTLFVNASIRYFQMIDKKDIIQGQHQAQAQQDQDHTEHKEETPEDILNAIGGSTLYSIEEADDLMMRKTICVSNLDNYVINTHANVSNDKRIIPMKLEVDLKASEFKTKGVQPKKVIKSKKKKEDLYKQIVGNENNNGGENA